METNNNLLNVTTIPEFFTAINEKYNLDLPTDFVGDSPVSKLMQKQIKVTQGNGEDILYTATARGDPFNFETPNLTAWVIITVKTSTAV